MINQLLAGADYGFLLRKDDPVNKVSSPTKFAEYISAGLNIIMTDCIGDFSDYAFINQMGIVLPSNLLDDLEAIDGTPAFTSLLTFISSHSSADRLSHSKSSARIRDKIMTDLSWKTYSRAFTDRLVNLSNSH